VEQSGIEQIFHSIIWVFIVYSIPLFRKWMEHSYNLFISYLPLLKIIIINY
jgi:hypothetical protein